MSDGQNALAWQYTHLQLLWVDAFQQVSRLLLAAQDGDLLARVGAHEAAQHLPEQHEGRAGVHDGDEAHTHGVVEAQQVEDLVRAGKA